MCRDDCWPPEHSQQRSSILTDRDSADIKVAANSRPPSALAFNFDMLALLGHAFTRWVLELRVYPVKFAGKILRIRKQLMEERDPLPQVSFLKKQPSHPALSQNLW